MSCSQCFEDIGILSQNISEQNKSVGQLVEERKSLSDKITSKQKRKTNLQKISLKKSPIAQNTIFQLHNDNNYPRRINNNLNATPNIGQLRQNISSKPSSDIRIIFSSNPRVKTQVAHSFYGSKHRPNSNHQYNVHINYNQLPLRNIILSFPQQRKDIKQIDVISSQPSQKIKNQVETKVSDASNIQTPNLLLRPKQEGLQQLYNKIENTSDLQRRISEQFQRDLNEILQQDLKKPQPSNISHKSKSLIVQKQVYLRPPDVNQDTLSSRISRTLSGTRNIQQIMCTKTQSVGSDSSSSQLSQIILRANNQVNNQFKLRNSSTTFNVVQPTPQSQAPSLACLFNSGKTKKTKAKGLLTKRSFSDK